MKLRIVIALVAAAYFTSLAFSAEKKCSAIAEAIPLCSVLADAAKYDGTDVTVKGSFYSVIHGSILTASACAKSKVNIRLAPHWKADKHAVNMLNSLTRRNRGADVVVRGTFRVAHDGCFGQTCTLYEIEEQDLLCAEAPKPSDGEKTNRSSDHEAGHSAGATPEVK